MNLESSTIVLAAILLALTSASLPNAKAASLISNAAVGASNSPNTFPAFEPGGSAYSGTGALVSASGSASFTGQNSNGEETIMTFTGSASAWAQSYGQLRTAASGTVSGVYYNENNAPYYSYNDHDDDDEETGHWDIDPNGSPTFLVSYGQAQFSDTLNYGNIPAGFTTDFWFHISGSFTGGDVYHSILVNFGLASDNIVLYPVSGANHLWTTNKFTPLPGVDVDFSTTVLSSFNFYPEYSSEGGTYSGSADFMNTVTLAGINVYDENDNLVTDWALTSGSGTLYPGSIPEPSAALLGLAGAAGFLARRRRF